VFVIVAFVDFNNDRMLKKVIWIRIKMVRACRKVLSGKHALVFGYGEFCGYPEF
jgi:hypothetical protein